MEEVSLQVKAKKAEILPFGEQKAAVGKTEDYGIIKAASKVNRRFTQQIKVVELETLIKTGKHQF